LRGIETISAILPSDPSSRGIETSAIHPVTFFIRVPPLAIPVVNP
jgi:hypothetical protein